MLAESFYVVGCVRMLSICMLVVAQDDGTRRMRGGRDTVSACWVLETTPRQKARLSVQGLCDVCGALWAAAGTGQASACQRLSAAEGLLWRMRWGGLYPHGARYLRRAVPCRCSPSEHRRRVP